MAGARFCHADLWNLAWRRLAFCPVGPLARDRDRNLPDVAALSPQAQAPRCENPPWINRFPATVLNFSFVTLGWLFFHNDASAMASGLLDPLAWLFIPLVAAGILLVLRGFQWFAELTLSPGWRAVYALILSLMFYYGMNTGFIYAKF